MGTIALLVDDDPGIVGLLADLLVDEEYTVRTAADGQEALEEIARAPADVVVADVMMPGVDGVTLITELRKQGYETPVVLMSAVYADVDLPGVRFVPKPFDLDHVVDVVNRVVAEARATGDVRNGLRAGAADRLGPDDGADDPEARPRRNQHSFAGEAFATDTAHHDHGPDDPA